ncbi:uncharacterized protein [Phyllobates terribilis]|uniref:uncharacterized protein n=1 Tax=Phyllobates terribilis TaxID=111132 RepID=UPI003CCAFE0F
MEANNNTSILLELSAADDLASFKKAVEEEGLNVDKPSAWYGRRMGSKKKMGLEERTPLMVAAMYGSKDVLSYILDTGRVDPNRACGSDGATALHMAAASGSCLSHEIVKLLIEASADVSCLDTDGKQPCHVVSKWPKSFPRWIRRNLVMMLNGETPTTDDEVEVEAEVEVGMSKQVERKEYPVDPSLPDMNEGIYSTNEFRMYVFKVRPCSRAYSHDWTECPFVHPGENARRRDPSKYHYSCVPCPDFRKGSCPKADGCEFAHGIFESWLHPAQYRTRMCKDEPFCTRKICFFAHATDELRSSATAPSPSSSSPSPWASPPPPLQLTGPKATFNNALPKSPTRNTRMNPQTYYRYSSSLPCSPLKRPIAFSPPTPSSPMMPSRLSYWGSPPDTNSNFGMLGQEMSHLRKSVVSPDISWVHSIIKDTPSLDSDDPSLDEFPPSWLEPQWTVAS